jgi:hypothetical protein
MSSPIVSAIIGSGTIPATYAILPSSQRGYIAGTEGLRFGNQVMVGNPEDMVAVDAFAASGVSVGATAIEVVAFGNNPLPRCREIWLENTGSNPILISHKSVFADPDCWQIAATSANGAQSLIKLPILKNVSIWAKSTSGSTLRILVF